MDYRKLTNSTLFEFYVGETDEQERVSMLLELLSRGLVTPVDSVELERFEWIKLRHRLAQVRQTIDAAMPEVY
jgi:hypothetical protein